MGEGRRTGTHIGSASDVKVFLLAFLRGEPEVAQYNLIGILLAKDVIGLQVAVVDMHRVANLNRVADLKEDLLDVSVVYFVSFLHEESAEVAVGAEFCRNKEMVVVLVDALFRATLEFDYGTREVRPGLSVLRKALGNKTMH